MKDWGSKSWFGECGEMAGWLYGYLNTASTVDISIASIFDVLVKYFNYTWVKIFYQKLKNAKCFCLSFPLY